MDFVWKASPLTPSPLFLADNIKMDRIPTKSDGKYTPFLYCISSFEGISFKNL